MRDRLIELLRDTFNYTKGTCIDFDEAVEINADYLLEMGVIHIPCKVGDIVYQTDGVRIYELTILDIYLRKNKPYYETDCVDFDDDAIGKSIFLTKEKAERALKGGAEE